MSYGFDLFSPFLHEGNVDQRLLDVLGLESGGEFQGHFDKILDVEENTCFDFYLEGKSGRKIFFVLKLSEGFGTCEDDERHRLKLERLYRPRLEDHVDRKWLEPATFFNNYEILSSLSYLGRHADSGVAFIFPRANEGLDESESAIKQIVSKSLAPRVSILYLEYLVERLLAATSDDPRLQEHVLEFREKYLA